MTDISNVSPTVAIEQLVTRIAKEKGIPLPEPSKEGEERVSFPGGLVETKPPSGLVEGVCTLDYASFYPNIILSFNLSPEVSLKDRKVRFSFEREGLFPMAIRSLMISRKEIDRKLKENPGSVELQEEKASIKAGMASFYGVLANPYFKWHSVLLASKITELGREILSFTIERAREKGFNVVYYDTDSVLVQCPREKGEALAKELTSDVRRYLKEKYAIPDCTLTLRFQDYAERVLFFGVSKNYVKLVEGRPGFVGVFRKNMSQFELRFTEMLYSAAVLKISRKEMERFVERERENFRKAPLSDIAMVGTVRSGEYKVDTPLVRAVRYAKERGEKVKAGDSIRWLWVKGPQNVVGWKEKVPEDIVVDYERLEDLQISRLVKELFNILYPSSEERKQKTLF